MLEEALDMVHLADRKDHFPTQLSGGEQQRVLVIIEITSPTDQWILLGDGYRVDTKFITWHEDDVLQIPKNTLFRNGDGWAVFVANNENKAEL